jgi:DNA-binding MarR family transcriptional regulator
MKIEEEIKQIRWRSEKQKAVINIIFTANWIHQQQSKLLKRFGLTSQQYNVLRILRGQKGNPITVKSINERMLDRMSNVSRLVDKLVNKKLVDRAYCQSDRRRVDIVITKKGLAFLDEIDPLIEQLSVTLEAMSEDEAGELNDLLNRVRETEI